jgi:hypothetical protein
LNNVGPNNHAWLSQAGFILGLSFGAMMGFIAMKLAHGLVFSVVGRRSERLLVKYHDAFRATEELLAESACDEDRIVR